MDPSFYPKHLARRQVSKTFQRDRQQVRAGVTASTATMTDDNLCPTETPAYSVALGGLPAPFVEAMKKLFDLVDVSNRGKVKVEDIAGKWAVAGEDENNDATNNKCLPSGVVASLKKVTTADGYLTFERFCAGLKIAMLRHNARKKPEGSNSQSSSLVSESDSSGCCSAKYSSSSSTKSIGDDHGQQVSAFMNGRTSSLPNILHSEGDFCAAPPPQQLSRRPRSQMVVEVPPPKPPRLSFAHSTASLPTSAHRPALYVRKEVTSSSKNNLSTRTRKDGQPHSRRHTLQGGIDFTMMRRLKHWEEERRVLEEGLRIIHEAQEWYESRLSRVNERLRFGRRRGDSSSTSISSSEATQERLNFEMNSIREINQRLNRLAGMSELKREPDQKRDVEAKEFPTHINLEVTSNCRSSGGERTCSQTADQLRLMAQQIRRLKDQNKQLTQEVGIKSTLVTSLEHEKRSLIIQLFRQPLPNARQLQHGHVQQHHYRRAKVSGSRQSSSVPFKHKEHRSLLPQNCFETGK